MSNLQTVPGTSAYDRSKLYDVCIMTCNDAICYRDHVMTLLSSCKDAKLKYFLLKVLNNFGMEEEIHTAIVTAMIVCKHNEKEFRDCYKPMQTKTIVIAGSIGKVKSHVFRNIISNIENESSMCRLFDKIRTTVSDHSAYDDVRQENPYAEGIVDGMDHRTAQMIPGGAAEETFKKQVSTPTPMSLDFFKNRRFDLADDTCNRSSSADDNLHIIEQLTKEDEYGYTPLFDINRGQVKHVNSKDKFIDTKSLMCSDSHSGTFVFDEYILPTGKYDDQENLRMDEIVLMYNRDSCDDSSDFEKYIVTSVMRKCLTCRNFQGLVILLKCQKRSIQLNAFQNMENLLYTTEARRCNTQDFLYGITELTEIIELWSGDQELLLLLLHTVLTAFSVLFMAFNASMDTSMKSPVENICRNVKMKISKVEKLHTTNEILKGVFDHLKRSASCFSVHLDEVSVLRMGNWSDAMKTENNRLKIKNEFSTLSEIEQTTVIYGLLNQVILQPGGNHTPLLDALCACLKTMLNSKKKDKKDDVSVFYKLQLTTKMIRKILELSSSQVQACLDILHVYMDTIKVHQAIRRCLLKEISSLLYHRDERIVHGIFSILTKNNSHTHFDLRQITVSHVEKLLHPLRISIDNDSCVICSNVPVPPHWCQFLGTVNDDKDVNVHILLPSKNCIMRGIMEDYRANSNEKDILKNHETQRDMLHLLCREGMSSYVLPLVGFQCRPLPLFYITLKCTDRMLLSEHLLRKRNEKDWIPLQRLGTIAADIINAVNFLHSKGIVHRGLTTASFSISNDGQILLSSLITASEGHFSEFTSECKHTPLRWSAPESILYDRYSPCSDQYMVGQLLYELFTHGCHPYTELYRYQLDDVLQLIVFQNLKPRQWPCIPREIHQIILRFVDSNPVCRASLDDGLRELNTFLARIPSNQGYRKRLSNSHREDIKYPDLDSSLPKEPQKELPDLIKQLKSERENPVKSYANLRKTWRKPRTILAISEADITSSDSPSIRRQGQKLKVQEPISQKFFEVSFTELSKSSLQDVLNVTKWPPDLERKDPYTLHFSCNTGEPLSQLSLSRCYGDPDNQENNARYTLIIHHLVQFISSLHDRGWLSRDICCRHLYFDSQKQKVFSPRLGRMVYLYPDQVLDDSVMDEVFSDRKNWYPLETLQHGQYSKEGDVYMLAMAIYEFYQGLEVNLDNPMSSSMNTVPFSRIPKTELIEHILSGEVPLQPAYCPDDLYELMVKCWNRDRTQRPACTEILKTTSLLISQCDDITDCEKPYDELPEPPLPPRNPISLPSGPSDPEPCIQNNGVQSSSLSREYPFGQFTRPLIPSRFDNSKVNPLYRSGFDRADSKRSNIRKSSQWTRERMCNEKGTFTETSSLNSDSTLSIANSSSDSDFSFANSRSSWSETPSIDSTLFSTTANSSVEYCNTAQESYTSLPLENITTAALEIVRSDYIELLPDENADVENEDIANNTTHFRDSAEGIYNDFEKEDQYLDYLNPTFK